MSVDTLQELLTSFTVGSMTGIMLGYLIVIFLKNHVTLEHKNYILTLPLVMIPAYIILSLLIVYAVSFMIGFLFIYVLSGAMDWNRCITIGIQCLFYIIVGNKYVIPFILCKRDLKF